MPRHRLISFRAGDDRLLAAAGLAKTLTQVNLDRQDVALGCHFDVFHGLLLLHECHSLVSITISAYPAETLSEHYRNRCPPSDL